MGLSRCFMCFSIASPDCVNQAESEDAAENHNVAAFLQELEWKLGSMGIRRALEPLQQLPLVEQQGVVIQLTRLVKQLEFFQQLFQAGRDQESASALTQTRFQINKLLTV